MLEIVDSDLVIFVDASVDTDGLRIEDIQPNPDATVMTHHGDPASLLSLAGSEGSAPKRASLVSIPAQNLGLVPSSVPQQSRRPKERPERSAD